MNSTMERSKAERSKACRIRQWFLLQSGTHVRSLLVSIFSLLSFNHFTVVLVFSSNEIFRLWCFIGIHKIFLPYTREIVAKVSYSFFLYSIIISYTEQSFYTVYIILQKNKFSYIFFISNVSNSFF